MMGPLKSVKYLYGVCIIGNISIVKFLIEHGIDINGGNHYGKPHFLMLVIVEMNM